MLVKINCNKVNGEFSGRIDLEGSKYFRGNSISEAIRNAKEIFVEYYKVANIQRVDAANGWLYMEVRNRSTCIDSVYGTSRFHCLYDLREFLCRSETGKKEWGRINGLMAEYPGFGLGCYTIKSDCNVGGVIKPLISLKAKNDGYITNSGSENYTRECYFLVKNLEAYDAKLNKIYNAVDYDKKVKEVVFRHRNGCPEYCGYSWNEEPHF